MNRLKFYRVCLYIALICSCTTLFFYSRWYLRTQIPDVVRVEAGETQMLDLGIKQVSVQVVDKQKVLPGGIPIGIYLETRGVYVVDTGEVEASDGLRYEPADQVVQTGDYILAVNGKSIRDKEELVSCIQQNQDNIVILKLFRNGETIQVRLAAVESKENIYKLGIWVKDDTQGIGTLTYITEDMRFGALGHGISDADTGELLSVSGGDLYDTTILKIVKGERGVPGELSGMITYADRYIKGTILENTRVGIFGNAQKRILQEIPLEWTDVAFKQEIQLGKACVRSAVSGEFQDYEIEIQEIHLNEDDVNKGMIFQVTDPELLEMTGGVIQGMSGSPIIQDGKLVGAVTHVCVFG